MSIMNGDAYVQAIESPTPLLKKSRTSTESSLQPMAVYTHSKYT